MSKKIEIGKWNKLPHYSVVGHPQDFYVYLNKNGNGLYSESIKGVEAFRLYHALLKIKDKKLLAERLEEVYYAHIK